MRGPLAAARDRRAHPRARTLVCLAAARAPACPGLLRIAGMSLFPFLFFREIRRPASVSTAALQAPLSRPVPLPPPALQPAQSPDQQQETATRPRMPT